MTGTTETVRAGAGLFDLTGRVVIVTGASAGIGAYLVRGLACSGARVVAAARRLDRLTALATEIGDNVLPVSCDVAVDADRQRLVEQAAATFGGIDGLVNNAGISGSGVPASRQSTEEFREVLEVDLVAPFDLAKLVLPHLRARGGGSIVNVTSTAAVVTTGSTIPQAAYCAAKGGLAHLTRELAMQWGRYGVRVNAFAPGFFATEMTAPMTSADGSPPAWLAERQAIRSVGTADDALGIVTYLLSDASRFVTGQHVAVDGGYTIS
jgi:NAD(P)-dependent dehydrogenase (short-subunit alcohol dehydrogenase family)